jgi:methyl-accepting chemotaxis protein
MHDTLLVIFTGILAFAVLAQSILFFLLYKIIRQLTVQVDGLSKDLLKHIGRVSAKVEATLATITSVAEVVKPVVQKLNESADIVHGRILELNDFLGEVTDKARFEIAELQDSVHDAVQRAQEAISSLRDNLLGPIHQVNAITRAIRAAMDMLFRKRKTPSSKTSLEDDLFL